MSVVRPGRDVGFGGVGGRKGPALNSKFGYKFWFGIHVMQNYVYAAVILVRRRRKRLDKVN